MRFQGWGRISGGRRLAVALLGSAALAAPPLAVAADQAQYTYSGDADALPFEAAITVPSFAAPPLVDARYPHARATYTSGSPKARAATLDPGALADTGPAEARGYGVPAPDYTNFAEANGSKPSDSGTMGGKQLGPLTVNGGDYAASVSDSAAQAKATGAGASLSSGPGGIQAGAGTAQSSSAVRNGTLESKVSETLSSIVLFGQVRIGQLVADASTQAAGASAGRASGNLTLTGITVLGVPATIDGSGVHVAGQNAGLPQAPAAPLPAAPVPALPGLPGGGGSSQPQPSPSAGQTSTGPAQQYLDSLKAAGITIRLTAAARQESKGSAVYDGAALEVSEKLPDGTTLALDLGGLKAQSYAEAAPGLGAGASAAGLGSGGGSGAGLGAGTTAGGSSGLGAPGGSGSNPAGAGSKPLGTRLVGLLKTPTAVLAALVALFDLAALGAIALILKQPAAAVAGPTLTGL